MLTLDFATVFFIPNDTKHSQHSSFKRVSSTALTGSIGLGVIFVGLIGLAGLMYLKVLTSTYSVFVIGCGRSNFSIASNKTEISF